MNKYFTNRKGDNWRFHCIVRDKKGILKPLYLRKASDTKIRRHVKIKSHATPFNPLYKDYFKKRGEEREHRKAFINYNAFAGLRTIQPY